MIQVEVLLDNSRPVTATKELTELAAGEPKAGGERRRVWEFWSEDDAAMFAIVARNVPGVARVD